MDVSVTFKEILREKRSLHALKTPKDEILPRAHQIKSPFLLEALAIAKGVRRMRRYLLDHAADYIDAHRHFAAKRARMTDRERDELDEELNVCMRECCKKIDHLKLELETRKDYQLLGENAREHLQGVVMDLYKRLEDLSRLHAQHKALRMQHQLEERRAYYHRVGPPTARAGLGRSGLTTRGAGVGLNHADDDDEKADAGIEDVLRRGSATAKRRKAGGEGEREEDEGEEDDGGEGNEGELTASERATLRQENATMQRNFETTLDKTREIEQQVLEISHLQTLFADKVSQQKEAIEDIHKKAIESVDAVQRGNEYLQSATKSGRDFRVFILIFLLVCSFSLLFLHWYD